MGQLMVRQGPLPNAHPSPGHKVPDAGFQPARVRLWAKTEGQSRKCKGIFERNSGKVVIADRSASPQESAMPNDVLRSAQNGAFVKYSLQE
jgi:hypothetical protein